MWSQAYPHRKPRPNELVDRGGKVSFALVGVVVWIDRLTLFRDEEGRLREADAVGRGFAQFPTAAVHAAIGALARMDSVTIDPHKAGYIPYAAGGLCYRNQAQRNLVAFQAPEVYHGESLDANMGIYGVEGSKPGAAAAVVQQPQVQA